GAALIGIAWTATRYLAGTEIESSDTLMQNLYLVGIALGTAGVIALFLLIQRIDPARPTKLRFVDVLPVARVAVSVPPGVLRHGARRVPARVRGGSQLVRAGTAGAGVAVDARRACSPRAAVDRPHSAAMSPEPLRSYDELIAEVRRLCAERRTGTLFIAAADN